MSSLKTHFDDALQVRKSANNGHWSLANDSLRAIDSNKATFISTLMLNSHPFIVTSTFHATQKIGWHLNIKKE